ncbi:MAG: aminotransferase class I/II-fold pyridoxal phosphate-dependent enzyme [Aggregatilineales bacterium]
MPEIANRLKSLPHYVFSIIGDNIRDLQKQGIDVIRLDVGSPDMPPPESVMDSMDHSVRKPDNHGYAGYRGIPSYRQAVARYYKRRFNVTLDPDKEILPVIGSKEGIINLIFAYIDDGDTVLVPDIGYPSYAMGTQLAHGKIAWMPLSEADGYLPNFDAIPLEVASSAKMMWLNYPNNPTGAVADLDFYKKAVDFCQKHDIILASDNPYADITYDGYHASSMLEASNGNLNNLIEFFSLSKSHNMAGWRIGAAVGSQEVIDNLLHVKSNVDSGHFKAIYEAAITALDDVDEDWINKRNKVYARRRDILLEALPDIGLSAKKTSGSLYIWAKVLDGDEEGYVNEALTKAHVSLAPGSAYGPGGEGYIRISVGIEDDRLDEAINRLKAWYSESISKEQVE